MWKIVLELSIILLVAILLTQVIVPILFDGKLFWFFRKSSPSVNPPKPEKREKSFDETIDSLAKEKDKAEKERQRVEDEIKDKINKVNKLNN